MPSQWEVRGGGGENHGGVYLTPLELWRTPRHTPIAAPRRPTPVVFPPFSATAADLFLSSPGVLHSPPQVLSLLLAADASADAADDAGRTPLHAAMHAGRFGAARKLLEAGASANIPDGQGVPPLWLFLRQNRPLIDPWSNPHAPVECMSLGEGAAPGEGGLGAHAGTWRDGEGGGSEDGEGEGELEDSDEEADGGFRGRARPEREPEEAEAENAMEAEAPAAALTADEAAAAAAAEAGWGSLLLAHGVELDTPSPAGWTALYLAAQEGLLADAAWLLKWGARADAPASDGATPLHVACQAHQPAMVRMLVQHASDSTVAAQASNCLYADLPPLHVVCSGPLSPAEAPMAMARALLDARADPSQTDGLGVSPLRLLAGAAAPSGEGESGGGAGSNGEPSSLEQYFDACNHSKNPALYAGGSGGGSAGFGVCGDDDDGRAQLAVRSLPLSPPPTLMPSARP